MALKRKIKKRRGRREGEKERLAREGSTKTRSPEQGKIKICPRRYIIRPTTFVRPRNLHVKRGPATSNLWFFFSLLSLSLFLSLPLSFLLFHSPCSEGWEIYNVGDYVAFSFFAKNPVIPPFLHFLSPDFLFFSFSFSFLDRARKTSLQGVNARKKLARSQLLSSTLVSQGLSVE